jgi:hypothetical protein
MKTALCIGINDYPGTDSDLYGCVNDCFDWSSVFKNHGFVIHNNLTDKLATRENILRNIKEVIEKTPENGSIVIQYSGHGTFIPDLDGDEADGVDECWCPHDIMTNGPIIDDELFRLFKQKKKGVKLVLISDSCHSGTVMRFSPFMMSQMTRRVKFLPPTTFMSLKNLASLPPHRINFRQSGYVKLLISQTPALLLAGCQDTEYSYDAWFGNRANGAFTYFSIDRLKAIKPKTYTEWYSAIRSILPSVHHPQTPNIVGSEEQCNWGIFS